MNVEPTPRFLPLVQPCDWAFWVEDNSGRTMIQEAMNWDMRVEVMDPSLEASCRHLTHRFVQAT